MVGPTMSPATANAGSRWWLVRMVGAVAPTGGASPPPSATTSAAARTASCSGWGPGHPELPPVPGTAAAFRRCLSWSTQHTAPTGLSTKGARPRSRKDYTCPGRPDHGPDHDISHSVKSPCEYGSFCPGRRERIDLPFDFWALVDTGVPDSHLGVDERLGEAASRPRLRPRQWSPDRRRCGRR